MDPVARHPNNAFDVVALITFEDTALAADASPLTDEVLCLLKRKVLDALKSEPRCPIWVEGRCIYAGNERHFTRDEPIERGRTLADRITRDRSRSPPRGRALKRSKSSSQRNGNHTDGYGRQRSPNPNEQYHTRSYFQNYEDYSAYSNAHRQSPRQDEQYRSRSPIRQRYPSPHRSPHRQQLYKSNFLPTTIAIPLPKLAPRPISAQAPLGEATNVSRSPAPVLLKPVIQNTAVQRSPLTYQQNETLVEDPFFVLGISEGATESEIIDAYELAIYEIDLERMAEGGLTGPGAPPSIFDESIKILNAAKRQLLGY